MALALLTSSGSVGGSAAQMTDREQANWRVAEVGAGRARLTTLRIEGLGLVCSEQEVLDNEAFRVVAEVVQEAQKLDLEAGLWIALAVWPMHLRMWNQRRAFCALRE